ncbi:MAG: insulinase family protein [Alphaproteobacteria bacterium]|nr:insulinase family protein [Alphaproteobacteria bacterium]
MSKPQVTTLKNGLTVITQQVPGEQVYANITVNVGNRHEAHDHKDVAHFLEHMAASETQRMNIPEREAYISNRYGTSNAMTMDQYTGYHIQMNSNSRKMPSSCWRMASCARNSTMRTSRTSANPSKRNCATAEPTPALSPVSIWRASPTLI